MNQSEIIPFVLQDQRNCRSRNMQKFFRDKKNKHLTHVVMFDGRPWFASLGWDPDESGFAGVKVLEVACQGAKAKPGYPSWQKPGSWTDITESFWDKYQKNGIIAFPEIWHIKIPA